MVYTNNTAMNATHPQILKVAMRTMIIAYGEIAAAILITAENKQILQEYPKALPDV